MSDLDDFFKDDELESLLSADEKEPIPSGTYRMEAIKGELKTASTGTRGYKITWSVIDGEHEGRWVWQDLWLTPRAKFSTARQLRKLFQTQTLQPDDLKRAIPEGITADVTVVVRNSEDGIGRNEVNEFRNVKIEADPFAPQATTQPAETPITKVATEPAAVEPPKPSGQHTTPKQDEGDRQPQHVCDVAANIPPGEPVTVGELEKATGLNPQFIYNALRFLQQNYDLREKMVNANYVYIWAEQPRLQSSGPDPDMVELSEEEWRRQLKEVEIECS